MPKKFILSFIVIIGVSLSNLVNAEQNIANKNDPSKIKDCHGGINRSCFWD